MSSGIPTKKHKKNKKHKSSHAEPHASEEGLSTPGIKLKIKFGGGQVSSEQSIKPEPALEVLDPSQMVITQSWIKSEVVDDEEDYSTSEYESLSDAVDVEDMMGHLNEVDVGMLEVKKEEVHTSDEEKEWLDALEAGKLDDSGGVLKKKDPMLMTARQRAMHLGADEQLLQLPTVYKKAKLTDKQQKLKTERDKKRKQLAQEKREKDKKDTLERLLKKQDSKRGAKSKSSRRSSVPAYRYQCNADGVTISVPEKGHDPYIKEIAPQPPIPKHCGVSGCKNLRKYSCSKTGVSLCSLECYKKNAEVSLTVPMQTV